MLYTISSLASTTLPPTDSKNSAISVFNLISLLPENNFTFPFLLYLKIPAEAFEFLRFVGFVDRSIFIASAKPLLLLVDLPDDNRLANSDFLLAIIFTPNRFDILGSQ